MEIRVLLIALEDTARNIYFEAISRCGVHVYAASSCLDFSQEICDQTFHGIFLDLPTKIKALKNNKNLVYGLLEHFPVCLLKIHEKTEEIVCFHATLKLGGTMQDFIDHECRNSVPRMIRSDARKTIHLNVILYKSPDRNFPERSVTMNISKSGCFVFSIQEWEIDDDIWIEFLEISDGRLIHGTVRNSIKWGKLRRIPGIGIEFQNIFASRISELIDS
jgi:hypothetical protein